MEEKMAPDQKHEKKPEPKNQFPALVRVIQAVLAVSAFFVFIAGSALLTTFAPVFAMAELIMVAALVISIWAIQKRKVWAFSWTVTVLVVSLVGQLVPEINLIGALLNAVLLVLVFHQKSFLVGVTAQ